MSQIKSMPVKRETFSKTGKSLTNPKTSDLFSYKKPYPQLKWLESQWKADYIHTASQMKLWHADSTCWDPDWIELKTNEEEFDEKTDQIYYVGRAIDNEFPCNEIANGTKITLEDQHKKLFTGLVMDSDIELDPKKRKTGFIILRKIEPVIV